MRSSLRCFCQRGLIIMNPNPRNRASRRDFLLASLLVTAGLVLSGLSLIELAKGNVHMAQATQPLQASPPAAPNGEPAESKPGGARPTTPAPEPAQPNAAAQTTGAASALPLAPAEKIAPPIQQK
jgi:hypothetical protein